MNYLCIIISQIFQIMDGLRAISGLLGGDISLSCANFYIIGNTAVDVNSSNKLKEIYY